MIPFDPCLPAGRTQPPLRVRPILAFLLGNDKVFRKALRNRTRLVCCLLRSAERLLFFRPHRLTARTAPFHGANRGSIPREVTKRDSVYLQDILSSFSGTLNEYLNSL